MSRRGDSELLQDILESIKRIKNYTATIDYNTFKQDIKTQDAVVRNLEIIGEAVKKISSEVKEENKSVEWKKIAGMRNKIVHYYFGVNWDIVWNVIQEKLSP